LEDNTDLGSEGVVAGILSPAGNTEKLSVGLAESDVGLAVTNGHPGVGSVSNGDPDILVEEGLPVTGVDGSLGFSSSGEASTHGGSVGLSLAVGQGTSSLDEGDVAAGNEANESAESVVGRIIGPSWDTEELGVALGESNVGLAVTNGNPGISGVADGDPHVLLEEGLVPVSLDGTGNLSVSGEARTMSSSKLVSSMPAECSRSSDKAELVSSDLVLEDNGNVVAESVVGGILRPHWSTKELGVVLSKSDVGLAVTSGDPDTVLVISGEP